MRFPELRQRVLAAARKAYQRGLVVATSGNYSLLDTSSRLMVITASGLDYDQMGPEDMVVVDLQGNVVEGERRPSSEWRLHAQIYERRPEVGGVAHTHSPYATAFAVLERSIPDILTETHYTGSGGIGVAAFAAPGSPELGEAVVGALGSQQAVLLSHHGLVAVGKTVEEALNVAFLVEDAARVYHLAATLGEPKALGD